MANSPRTEHSRASSLTLPARLSEGICRRTPTCNRLTVPSSRATCPSFSFSTPTPSSSSSTSSSPVLSVPTFSAAPRHPLSIPPVKSVAENGYSHKKIKQRRWPRGGTGTRAHGQPSKKHIESQAPLTTDSSHFTTSIVRRTAHASNKTGFSFDDPRPSPRWCCWCGCWCWCWCCPPRRETAPELR